MKKKIFSFLLEFFLFFLSFSKKKKKCCSKKKTKDKKSLFSNVSPDPLAGKSQIPRVPSGVAAGPGDDHWWPRRRRRRRLFRSSCFSSSVVAAVVVVSSLPLFPRVFVALVFLAAPSTSTSTSATSSSNKVLHQPLPANVVPSQQHLVRREVDEAALRHLGDRPLHLLHARAERAQHSVGAQAEGRGAHGPPGGREVEEAGVRVP